MIHMHRQCSGKWGVLEVGVRYELPEDAEVALVKVGAASFVAEVAEKAAPLPVVEQKVTAEAAPAPEAAVKPKPKRRGRRKKSDG